LKNNTSIVLLTSAEISNVSICIFCVVDG